MLSAFAEPIDIEEAYEAASADVLDFLKDLQHPPITGINFGKKGETPLSFRMTWSESQISLDPMSYSGPLPLSRRLLQLVLDILGKRGTVTEIYIRHVGPLAKDDWKPKDFNLKEDGRPGAWVWERSLPLEFDGACPSPAGLDGISDLPRVKDEIFHFLVVVLSIERGAVGSYGLNGRTPVFIRMKWGGERSGAVSLTVMQNSTLSYASSEPLSQFILEQLRDRALVKSIRVEANDEAQVKVLGKAGFKQKSSRDWKGPYLSDWFWRRPGTWRSGDVLKRLAGG
jgi:hypothetical protein